MYKGDMVVRIKTGKHYKNIRPYMNSNGKRNQPSIEERYHNTVDRFGGFWKTYLITFVVIFIIFFIFSYYAGGFGQYLFSLEGFSISLIFAFFMSFVILGIWILDG